MESNTAYAEPEAHGLYEKLTAAVSAVMIERPADPVARICQILQPVAPVATGVAMPVATIVSRADQGTAPSRVRKLFETLDTNADGTACHWMSCKQDLRGSSAISLGSLHRMPRQPSPHFLTRSHPT